MYWIILQDSKNLHMIWMHEICSYTGLQNKPTSHWREKKEKKRGDRARGKRAKEMESVKKEKICSSSVLSSLRATNTSIIPDA